MVHCSPDLQPKLAEVTSKILEEIPSDLERFYSHFNPAKKDQVESPSKCPPACRRAPSLLLSEKKKGDTGLACWCM
jgi:hypothetical protein